MQLLNWKNCLCLSALTYALYVSMWYVLAADDFLSSTPQDIFIDLITCFLFITFSLFYCRFIVSRCTADTSRHSYQHVLLYACLLFVINNMMAYLMTELCNMIWKDENSQLLQLKEAYAYGMISTFISCIYTNVFYWKSYIRTQQEKERLDRELSENKAVTLQAQLTALKTQIDSHFMFNDFGILSDLIAEDPEMAGKFLSELSHVYRYVIQNLKRDTVAVHEELRFLNSYLYLLKMRYEDTFFVNIDPSLKTERGFIAPTSLQMLVENAVRHNGRSAQDPLMIDITRTEDDYITVSNRLKPLVRTHSDSTGTGLENLRERYSLLSSRKVIVDRSAQGFAVHLPIL